MIANRLKEVLKDIISPYQSSFIPGRQSLDNVIICQEIAHTLRYSKSKKGGMILKLDLEKAYDRMDWRFVEETLRDIPLPDTMVHVIMNIIRCTSSRLIWNGELTESIKHDPLSPYIFVLCLERLSKWIQCKVNEGVWRPLQASRSGIKISHLFFADDLLLFAEADTSQVACILQGLRGFCNASGQPINFNKSSLYISPSVDEQEAHHLSTSLGIPLMKELGRYLGHYILYSGRNNMGHAITSGKSEK